MSGRPREVIHLPGNSWWPLVGGVMLALLCLSLLLKFYWASAAFTGLSLLVLLRWSWENGAHPTAAAGEAEDLPEGLLLHSRTFDGPGLWGMGLAVLADAALFGALLFGWLYLWTVVPDGAPASPSVLGVWPLAAVAALLAAGQWSISSGVRRLRTGHASGLALRLWLAAGFGALASAGVVALLATLPLEPTRQAHDAVLTFTLYYLLVHAGLAAVFTGLQAARVHLGYVGLFAPYEPAVVAIWWRFCTIATVLAWGVMALLPLVFGAPR